MGLWDRITGVKPIKVIEWVTTRQDETLLNRLAPTRIQYGATLLVQPDQAAVMTYRGQLADVYAPGRYLLDASTMPGLGALRGLGAPGLPFRAEITFVSTRPWLEQNWITAAPINVRDPDHGVLRLKATGIFGFAITDVAPFFRELATGDPKLAQYTRSEFHNLVVSRVSELIHTGMVSTAELFGSHRRLGLRLGELLMNELAKIGVTLASFRVTSITTSPDVRRPLAPIPSPEVAEEAEGADGFTAQLPAPVATVTPGAQRHRSAVADTQGLIDSLLEPTVPSAEPKSMRIPLVDAAPVGIFPSQAVPLPGGSPERLLLDDHSDNGNHLNGPPVMHPGASSGHLPPPLPQFLEFFVGIGGTPIGPFDLLNLAAKVREGSVTRSMLVWKPGMAGWVKAESLPELQPLFEYVPPPLPPT